MKFTIPVCMALAASAACAACTGDRPQHAPDATRVTTSNGSVTTSRHDTTGYPVIRALYLNRSAAQSGKKMRHMYAIADSTEINGFVIDMKDEFGLNYHSSNPAIRKNSGGDHGFVNDVRGLVDSVKAHGLVPIARIVAFKDPVAANTNPDWTIR